MATLLTENSLPPTSSIHGAGQLPELLALLECAAPRAKLERLTNLSHDSSSWSKLLQLAEDHRLIPLLVARAMSLDLASIPSGIRAALRDAQRAHAVRALQLTAELFHVLGRLEDVGIETLATKGPALSVRCYGDPGMRQYSDLDLVIRESDIRRVTQVMLELKYAPRVPLTAIDAKKTPGEYAFQKPGTQLLVEFHTERTFRYHPRPLRIGKVFERRASVSIDGREVPTLSLEDELVLICVHGAKHFWERLMWLADVAALISSPQPLDWDAIITAAREVGAGRILHLGLRLASDVLGAELPAQVKATVQSDRVVSALTRKIQSRLVSREPRSIGVLQRATFRVRMRGGLIAGGAYLLRLTLSPTEEDWTLGKEGIHFAFLDAIGRPFRLARKHRRTDS